MKQADNKEAIRIWKEHCLAVQSQTTVDKLEPRSEQIARVKRARKDYNFFVEYYFPHFAKCPCAKFQIQAANKVLATPNLKAVFKWARGHAKSTHLDIMIPLWLKCQASSITPTSGDGGAAVKAKQLNVMVLVGKSQDNANTLLSDIQAELEYNQRYINDFGLQKNAGSWTDGEFVTADDCAFFARGRGQSPRGLRYKENRPDYIVIDDLDDDELVENEARVSKMTDWVKEALFGALDGGRGRFVMVGNLIGKNSVLANIAAIENVYVSQVNIYDKNGDVSWAEKWTREEVKQMEQFMGYRSFQKENMNNPISEGAVFKNDWVRWKKLPPLHKYESIVAYCDPSFKGTSRNDYKAIKVWGKIGTELHHIRAFVRQCSTSEMVRWFYDLHESLVETGRAPSNVGTPGAPSNVGTPGVPSNNERDVICDYYMEANFLQDIILDEFTTEGKMRGYQLPIRADMRKKPDKFQRVEAVSPLWERGFVWYNEAMQTDRDMLAGIEQTLAFEKGSRAHDDAPDADEGAIYILQKRTRSELYAPVVGKRQSSKNAW